MKGDGAAINQLREQIVRPLEPEVSLKRNSTFACWRNEEYNMKN